MKKKLLFLMPSMFIGGAERSLIALLDSIDYEKYEINLFLYRHEGEFLSFIPKEVKILPSIDAYETFDVPIKQLLFSKKFIYGLCRVWSKFLYRINSKLKNIGVWAAMQYISRSLLPVLPEIPGEYDVAISFLGIPDVLAYRVNAKKRIAWNHTDYTILGPDYYYDQQIYKKIDYIVSVSDQCTNQFIKVYPQLKDKAITIENLLSNGFIMKQAEKEIDDFFCEKDYIKILSVGRFSEAKNFDNVPNICSRLLSLGLKVKWFLIGYGGDEVLIRKKIKEEHMEQNVIILGKKINPYPYIKQCDVYIQPSRYEGKCVSVIEAQILNKPVIITDYATAGKQLTNGVDGIIVGMNNQECAEGIAKVLRDRNLQDILIANTKETDYSNRQELEKLSRLL